MNLKAVEWILRIGVAGEFLGHGVLALQGKESWLSWFANFGVSDPATATNLLFAIGIVDVLVALIVLTRPIRLVLLWAAFWGFWTALVRPIVGEPIWDFIERFANWAAPLALLMFRGWPSNGKNWFK